MKIIKNASLKNYSSFKIGGIAKKLVEVESEEALIKLIKENQTKDNVFILGKGTKVLIADKGFDGIVIVNKIKGIARENDKLIVGSGTLFSEILKFCKENNLAGLEWAGGLPGTIGGAVRGNAGSFRGETKNNVLMVKSIKLNTGKKIERTNLECEFEYRSSIFKNDQAKDEFITEVVLEIENGVGEEVSKKIQENINHRKKFSHYDYPSVGCIFKNVPFSKFPENKREKLAQFVKHDPFEVITAAKLIAMVGLIGKEIGGAKFYEKQPNFIINTGNATSRDVCSLIKVAKEKVKKEFGVELREEIIYSPK